MPDDEDPLAAYEAEVADITDPGPFTFVSGKDHHGLEIARQLNGLAPMIFEDIVGALNNGRPGIVQYLMSTGTSITCSSPTGRELAIVVQIAADQDPFIIRGPRGD